VVAKSKASKSPFGKESRREILTRHFKQRPVRMDRAWEFVYRELLWIDGSTGLGHLYESDKAQPGRSVWYERTVKFTDRLCAEFGNITRDQLKSKIDQLFKECLQRLIEARKKTSQTDEIAQAIAEEGEDALSEEVVAEADDATEQPADYVPDADLVAEFTQLLIGRLQLTAEVAEPLARTLVGKARYYFTVERKRQNVLGEGFEDLLQLLIAKLTTVPADQIAIRKKADLLPGFAANHNRDRIEAPDLAVIVSGETKLLAIIKWSLRQDRQKQLSDELDCYAALLSQDQFPRYVLITNEYDPGRLINTNALSRRGQTISCMYHVNPDLLREVLSDGQKYEEELLPLVQLNRLRSVGDFLKDIEATYGTNMPHQPLTTDQKRQLRRRKQ